MERLDPGRTAMTRILLVGHEHAHVLDRVADDVFDHPVHPRWRDEFLADPRHHLAVAIDDDMVVGMASGVHYVHPDKPPELWVNEVGVAPTHRERGIGTALLRALFARGRALGCVDAWVLTDGGKPAARRLFAGVGGVEAPERPVMVAFLIDTDPGDPR